MSAPPPADIAAVVARVRALATGTGRSLLGITGPPGAGKSRLAAALTAAAGPRAALVAMDGFHLDDTVLDRLGSRDRKGAPDTFDAAGYVALLRRLRARDEAVVYAPVFDRDRERAVAAALAVPQDAVLVITEGNYLLGDGPFAAVRGLLDACWYVDIDAQLRVERLVARHVRHGRTLDAARTFVARSDERNAALVAATRSRADLVIDLTDWDGTTLP